MINSDSTAAMHSFTAGTVDGFTPSPSGIFDTGIMSALLQKYRRYLNQLNQILKLLLILNILYL